MSPQPECPAKFEPIPATLERHNLPPVAISVVGITTYRKYGLERGEHYRCAMAVTDFGTIVGLRRVRFGADG